MKLVSALLLLTVFPLCAQAPQPTIEQREKIVTVTGEVNRPGPVQLQGEMNLYAAIINAGGPTKTGSLRRVTVTRKGKETVYDLTEAKQQVLKAEPSDTIHVAKQNFFGR